MARIDDLKAAAKEAYDAGEYDLAEAALTEIGKLQQPEPTTLPQMVGQGLGILGDVGLNVGGAVLSEGLGAASDLGTYLSGGDIGQMDVRRGAISEALDYTPETQTGQALEEAVDTAGQWVGENVIGSPLFQKNISDSPAFRLSSQMSGPAVLAWGAMSPEARRGAIGALEVVPGAAAATKPVARMAKGLTRKSKAGRLSGTPAGEAIEGDFEVIRPTAYAAPDDVIQSTPYTPRETAVASRLINEQKVKPYVVEETAKGQQPSITLFGTSIPISGAVARGIEGDLADLSTQEYARSGVFGEKLQNEVIGYAKKQQERIEGAVGPLSADPRYENIMGPIQREATARSQKAREAWKRADENRDLYAFGQGDSTELVSRIKNALKDEKIPVDSQRTRQLMGILEDDYAGRAFTVGDINQMRVDINSFMDGASPTDIRYLRMMKNAFYEGTEDILDRRVAEGALGPNAPAAKEGARFVRDAVRASADEFALTRGNLRTERGKFRERQLSKALDELAMGTAGPRDVVQKILGNTAAMRDSINQVGETLGKPAADRFRKDLADAYLAKQLKTIFTEPGALRAAEGYQRLANTFDTIAKSETGDVLFDKAMRQNLLDASKALRYIVPDKDLRNFSGTGRIQSKLTDQVLRKVSPALADLVKQIPSGAREARRSIELPEE